MNQRISLPQFLQFSLAILLILTLGVLAFVQNDPPAVFPTFNLTANETRSSVSVQSPAAEIDALRWQAAGDAYASRKRAAGLAVLRWQKMGEVYVAQEFEAQFDQPTAARISSMRWQAMGAAYTK